MAVILGTTPCGLCQETLGTESDLRMFPVFVANARDPLHPFSDSAFHEACFRSHPLADQALARFREAADRASRRTCAACGQETTDPGDHFYTGFLSDASPFNYTHLHRSHFEAWPRAADFKRELTDLMSSPAWDGPIVLFDPLPRWTILEEVMARVSALLVPSRRMTARPVRGERLWMASIWLFLCAWLFGVAFWKAPSYEHLYRDVSVEPPAPTAVVLAACAFVARWWFLIAPVMAAPLVLVLTGRLDGKRGPFTVITILGLFVVIAFSSIYLFLPMKSVRARMERERSVQPP